MSEIADELERMADEFDGRVDLLQEKINEETDHEARIQLGSFADGLWSAAERLRERAVEVRALRERGIQTYKPQPKPAEAKAGQWWQYLRGSSVESPGRILRFCDCYAVGTNTDGGEWEARTSELHQYDEWHYLGDGPEPATK